jgi:hypothetical protein
MENFESKQEIPFLEIAQEITAMCDADQAMRLRAEENDNIIELEEDDNLDKVNTERMKEIVAQIGWPGASKVGKEAAHDAWVLVQHSDHDVEFQTLCLSLMNELPEDEVEPRDLAHFTDRVRLNSGKPQLYGTQFNQINKQHIPKDIEDPENVDERRKSMGLDTLAENIERMNKKYPLK